jgi:hypothetical protein
MGPRNAAVQYIYPMANSGLVSAFPIAAFRLRFAPRGNALH